MATTALRFHGGSPSFRHSRQGMQAGRGSRGPSRMTGRKRWLSMAPHPVARPCRGAGGRASVWALAALCGGRLCPAMRRCSARVARKSWSWHRPLYTPRSVARLSGNGRSDSHRRGLGVIGGLGQPLAPAGTPVVSARRRILAMPVPGAGARRQHAVQRRRRPLRGRRPSLRPPYALCAFFVSIRVHRMSSALSAWLPRKRRGAQPCLAPPQPHSATQAPMASPSPPAAVRYLCRRLERPGPAAAGVFGVMPLLSDKLPGMSHGGQ